LPDDSGPYTSTTRPARHAADAECVVDADGAGRNGLDRGDGAALPEPHDRAFAELLLDLADGDVEGLVTFFLVVEGHALSLAWRCFQEHELAVGQGRSRPGSILETCRTKVKRQ
jgi:hypothetical protein